MNKLAYCGLVCEECEIYQATIADDPILKETTAQKFSSPKYPIDTADINCYGCSGNDQAVFKFCTECEIRLCGVNHKLDNCGSCTDFPCSLLDQPFENSPENKQRLENYQKRV